MLVDQKLRLAVYGWYYYHPFQNTLRQAKRSHGPLRDTPWSLKESQPGGGGGSPHNDLYGEVSPDKVLNKVCERGAIFQQRVYERGTFFVKNGI